MMCYHSAVPELFHDKSDVCSDGIPGASCSVSCHSGHPAHALLIERRWASSYLPRQRSPSSRSSVCASLAGHRAPPRCAGTGCSTTRGSPLVVHRRYNNADDAMSGFIDPRCRRRDCGRRRPRHAWAAVPSRPWTSDASR
uniref:Uncharacterized protein n=1 Tax=Oryza rufipogon TaxID=4529 RepID=A0A0E0PZA9_ORYRU